jgi:hypothetical protein
MKTPTKMRVVALEWTFRYDVENEFVLDISEKQFKENPKRVYEVPATQFWNGLIVAKILRYAENDELQSITESLAGMPNTTSPPVKPGRGRKQTENLENEV